MSALSPCKSYESHMNRGGTDRFTLRQILRRLPVFNIPSPRRDPVAGCILICIFMLFGIIGCTYPFDGIGSSEDEYLYIYSEGAYLPVWIRGNTESGIFIVVIHGGPGGSSLPYRFYDSFEALEREYGVIYWEQRGSGSSQGNASVESLTTQEFTNDVGLVLDLLDALYEGEGSKPVEPSYFLLGHSCGGRIGTAFLLDGDNQARVSGWIEVDGGHDYVHGIPLSFEWMRTRIMDILAEPDLSYSDTRYWEKAREWYSSEGEVAKTGMWKHIDYVHRADGYIHDPAVLDEFNRNHRGEIVFASPSYYLAEGLNIVRVSRYYDFMTFDYTPLLADITIPSLVLWGRHDGILPVELAYTTLEALGTPDADKSLHIFEESAHSPMLEEPEDFADVVSGFIETFSQTP